MARLEPVGRVSDLAKLDLEPIIVPVVGYTEDKEEVITDIAFRPRAPLGRDLEMAMLLNGTDEVTARQAIGYLEECMTDEGREAWENLKESKTVFVERAAMGEVFRAVVAVYAKRPTTKRPGSRRTGQPSQTSQAASD